LPHQHHRTHHPGHGGHCGTDTDAVTVYGGVGQLPVIIIIAIIINGRQGTAPSPASNKTSFGVIVGVTTKGHSLSF